MPTAPDLVHDALMRALSRIPATREPLDAHPALRARAIAKAAAARTAAVSGSLSLPPGPAGWLTIVPDLTMVWKIQSQMVADIAGAFGRSSSLGREQMFFCLFRHAAAQIARDVAVRAGERALIRRSSEQVIESAARKAGSRIARRVAGRGLARWLPVAGAVGVAGYAYYDTMRVARAAIELFDAIDQPLNR